MTQSTETTSPFARAAAEGRLIREEWSREADGRQLLCWLTALTDDPETRPETCRADQCPAWLAYWLPWADDSGTEAAWPSHVTRLARVAHKIPGIDAQKSRRLQCLFLIEILMEARKQNAAPCDRVIALLRRELDGDVPTREEYLAEEAARAAEAAAEEAAWAAAAATEAAEAAWAACADRIISACIGHLETELLP